MSPRPSLRLLGAVDSLSGCGGCSRLIPEGCPGHGRSTRRQISMEEAGPARDCFGLWQARRGSPRLEDDK